MGVKSRYYFSAIQLIGTAAVAWRFVQIKLCQLLGPHRIVSSWDQDTIIVHRRTVGKIENCEQ